MQTGLVLVIVLASILGTCFFLVDMAPRRINLHPSIIAGISISYFFLVVMPEMAFIHPLLDIQVKAIEYLVVLAGVAVAHVSEKIIVQRVEKGTRDHLTALLDLKETLDTVQANLAMFIGTTMAEHRLDKITMNDVVQTLASLNQAENDVKNEIQENTRVLHDHVNEGLKRYHHVVEFIYHFIVGIILPVFLSSSLPGGFLFFTFAILMAVVSHARSRIRIFKNLDIEMDYTDHQVKHPGLALAAPLGITFSIVVELVLGIGLNVEVFLFPFVSGAILYVIMREVIPEKEEGRPGLFLLAIVVFSTLVILLSLFGY